MGSMNGGGGGRWIFRIYKSENKNSSSHCVYGLQETYCVVVRQRQQVEACRYLPECIGNKNRSMTGDGEIIL